jgi:N-acetylmuramoyl-L-alanine amidase
LPSIRNHRLVGDDVAFRTTPNTGGALKPHDLAFHCTAGKSAASSIESLCTRKPQGNASIGLEIDNAGPMKQVGDRWSKVEVEGWVSGAGAARRQRR